MRSLALRSLILILCGVGVGLVVGYKLALFREHQRLEHNKELVCIMEDKVFSEKDVEAAMNVAREIYTSDFLVHRLDGRPHGHGCPGRRTAIHTGGLSGLEGECRSLPKEITLQRVADGKLAEQWAINEGWDASSGGSIPITGESRCVEKSGNRDT